MMINTRAYYLLEREFQEYKNANIFGIFVTPIGDGLMEWVAMIQGLKDTLWEGAVLQLKMKYTEHYNREPPSIYFTTIPFHPNVDPVSGRPCVDFLDDPTKWNMKLTMSSILLAIQVLLSNPVLDNAVHLEAANMLKNNISLYRKQVIRCVATSQRLEDVISVEHNSSPSINFYVAHEQYTEQPRKSIRISYEDYYLNWFQIATSKTEREFKSPVFDDPDFIANCYNWMAANVAKGVSHTDIHRILSEKDKNPETFKEKENSLTVTPAPSENEKHTTSDNLEYEPWEQEVEDLVTWSSALG